MLFFGAFAPLVSLPVVGSVNAVRNGTGDGLIIIALAVASVIFILRRAYQWLWFSGFGSVVVIGLNFLVLQSRIAEVKSQMDRELADNPFRGLADVALQAVRIE